MYGTLETASQERHARSFRAQVYVPDRSLCHDSDNRPAYLWLKDCPAYGSPPDPRGRRQIFGGLRIGGVEAPGARRHGMFQAR
jgi:hypothetical protein